MNEFLAEEENLFHEDVYTREVKKILAELLTPKFEKSVSDQDLKKAGLLGLDETLIDFIFSQLRLDESLQAEALEIFCDKVPPPLDTEVLNQLPERILSQGEEQTARLWALKNGLIISDHLSAQGLIESILAAAAITKTETGEETLDPHSTQIQAELSEILSLSGPIVVKVNGELCWAVRLPVEVLKRLKPGFEAYVGNLQKFLPDEHIVVGDPDLNAAISSEVFTNLAYLKYFLAIQINELQQQLKFELEKMVEAVRVRKSAETQE